MAIYDHDMRSILSQLLIHPVPTPHKRGRVVRFGQEEPDIQLATGTMEERIQAFLKRNQCPATAKEIAVGIGTNNSRVTRVIQQLVKSGRVHIVKIEGCVTEYELAIGGTPSQ